MQECATMYKIFKIAVMTSLFLHLSSHAIYAQNYKGGYLKDKKENNIDKKLKRPVPKIFSSKLESTTQAEKLDNIYNNLLISLWIYAGTDFSYKKKLYSHIEPIKFQNTRYSKEFTDDMNDAMDNLNNNYQKMTADIENAQKKYLEIKEGIKMADHEILENLWNEKINELKEKSDQYFQLQAKFLNTYKSLVSFILKQGGKYYYKSSENSIYFYKFGAYQLYGKMIDKLNMINFKQKKLLNTMVPANFDITINK